MPIAASKPPGENAILAALPETERQILAAELEPVALEFEKVLQPM